MVNTVVTFGDNRISSVASVPIVIDADDDSSSSSSSRGRRLYLTVGLFLVMLVLFPTILSIKHDRQDFAYHLLFIVHSGFLCLFLLSTFLYQNVGDGLTTIVSLLLLVTYKMIHYFIRYRFCQLRFQRDFLLSTLQLVVILILVIIYILWTCFLIRNRALNYRPNSIATLAEKRKRLFYSLLSLNLMLTISSFLVSLPNADRFGQNEILLLAIGIPLAMLWFSMGIVMSMFKNCLSISTFYLLSILQPFYLVYLTLRTIQDWHHARTEDFVPFFPLFLIVCVCVSCSGLVHLSTMITGCWLMSRTEQILIESINSMECGKQSSTIDHDQSFNLEEIEQLMSNDPSPRDADRPETRPTTQSVRSLPNPVESQSSRQSMTSKLPVQNLRLSLEQSLSASQDEPTTKSNTNVLKVKTSNVPGPVGLLPVLKTNEDLKRLKEDKSARDTLMTDEENANVKRTKRSADLFSLNIDNYPSYAIALKQLQDSFSCEPISIHTALVKARLGIKKRIPLMCAAVTHYDRQESTILIDKSGHIRATFIGDDESLDNYNIRVGHTLVLRNVAVFTATRHRHHYVNIHLQNIIAIQDPLSDTFSMPSMSQEQAPQRSMLCAIEHEISAYEDASGSHNETFQVFSQSDLNDGEQPSLKKMNTNGKASSSAAFTHINGRGKSPPPSSVGQKFKATANHSALPIATVRPTVQPPKPAVPARPPVSVEVDLVQMVEQPIDADLNGEAMTNLINDIEDEFFASW